MMLMSEAAAALDGDLIGNDVMFTSVGKDTRDLARGSLYVAIKGGRFDGHEFVEQAGEAGAAGALVSRRLPVELPQICVDDTRSETVRTVSDLAGWPATGVRGSTGKSSA